MPLRFHRRPISLPLTLAQLAGSLLSFAVAGVLGYLLLGMRNDNPSDLFFCILAVILGIVLLITSFSRLKYRRFLVWECEEGFLEFDERGAVKTALRWDAIQIVWHRVRVSQQSREAASHNHTNSVQGPRGKEVTLNYPDLWQRIETEFVRQHLPQALATIRTGQVVSFGNVVVSAQGIASGPTISNLDKALPNPKPAWQLPWQEIPYITVNDGWIEFTPPSGVMVYHAPVFARFSDLTNMCLLKALVQALTNNQMQWIEKPRRWVHVENKSPAA